MWPDNRILDLFGIDIPIIQAPMAGSVLTDMVVAVSEAGGLGSLACALLSVEQARRELELIRRKTSRPINVNFFCYQQPRDDPAREMSWRRRLDAYYIQLGLDGNTAVPSSNRAPLRGQNVRSCHGVPSGGCQLPFRSSSQESDSTRSEGRREDYLLGDFSGRGLLA